MPKPIYDYRKNDNFYDTEILDNVFVSCFYNPYNNSCLVTYIDDDHIIQTPQDRQYIETIIRKRNNNFNGPIYWENLHQLQPNPNTGELGLINFAKRFGMADLDTYLNFMFQLANLSNASFLFKQIKIIFQLL